MKRLKYFHIISSGLSPSEKATLDHVLQNSEIGPIIDASDIVNSRYALFEVSYTVDKVRELSPLLEKCIITEEAPRQ